MPPAEVPVMDHPLIATLPFDKIPHPRACAAVPDKSALIAPVQAAP
jgi:hypothetical protein